MTGNRREFADAGVARYASSKRTRLRLTFVPVVLVALSSAACRMEPQQPPGPATLLDVDFRTTGLAEAKLKPSFPGAFDLVRSSPEGLRISIPDEGIKQKETGVLVPFTLRGDFEVSVAYEVLDVGDGWGASVEIYLATNAPTKEALGFNRVAIRDGPGNYFVTRLTTDPEGKRVDLAGDFERTTQVRPAGSSGQLRLARVGAIALLSARDAGGELRELFQVPLGTEDVARLRVGVNPRRIKPVDVRLLNLKVVGTSLSGPEAPPTRRLWLWFATALFTLAAVAAGLWNAWFQRRRPRPGQPHEPAASGQDPDLPAQPAASK